MTMGLLWRCSRGLCACGLCFGRIAADGTTRNGNCRTWRSAMEFLIGWLVFTLVTPVVAVPEGGLD